MSPAQLPDIEGFPPIVSPNAHTVILGSMPGATSLLKQQYYGHPRNAFWPVMDALFGAHSFCYQSRKERLTANGIAVWDVLQRCNRTGSLDSNIELASIKMNDFAGFFSDHPLIKRVYFNGGMAEKLYNKFIMPTLNSKFSYLEYQRLPSTSPANASLTLAQKIEAWQVIMRDVIK